MTDETMTVCLRNGVRLWITRELSDKLKEIITRGQSKYIDIGGRLINVVEITGILENEDLAEADAKRKGNWICRYGWEHFKNEECKCGFNGRTLQPDPKPIGTTHGLKRLDFKDPEELVDSLQKGDIPYKPRHLTGRAN